MTRQEAQKRNFKVMRLRGLYTVASQLFDIADATTIKVIIDKELTRLKAKTMAQKATERMAKYGSTS